MLRPGKRKDSNKIYQKLCQGIFQVRGIGTYMYVSGVIWVDDNGHIKEWEGALMTNTLGLSYAGIITRQYKPIRLY